MTTPLEDRKLVIEFAQLYNEHGYKIDASKPEDIQALLEMVDPFTELGTEGTRLYVIDAIKHPWKGNLT